MKTFSTTTFIFLFWMLLTSCGNENPASPSPQEPEEPENPNLVSLEIGSTGGEITSSDDRLVLTIPAGALGNTEMITIEEISAENLGAEFDLFVNEIGIEKAYNLGPDGLEFNDPITVNFQSDQIPVQEADSIGVFPEFLLTSSNGTVEALDNIRTEPNFDDGTLMVHGQLTHFSPLATSQANNGVSFFVFDVPESLPVGGMFTARAEIYESAAGPLGDLVTVLGPAMYEDNSGSPIAPDFTPTTVEIDGNSDDGFTGMYKYTCTAAGIGVYRTELNVRVRFDLDSGPVVATSFAPFITTIECIEAATVTLNVEKEGEGTITSEDGQINCGENCSAGYDQGSETTLTATPEEGWMFKGWSGDVPEECDGQTGDCTVVMDEDKTVTATFVKEEDPFDTFIFEELLVCVEHSSNESDIFWRFQVDEFPGAELMITMEVIRPDGTKEEVTLTSYSQAGGLVLFHLDIFVVGDYDWEIVSVKIDGEEVPFDGMTSGTVNVTGNVENPGQCVVE